MNRLGNGLFARDMAWTRRIKRHRLMLATLFAALLLGILLARSYGISWDEVRNAKVGEAAIKAYQGSDAYFNMEFIADHGPVYFMAFSTWGQWIQSIVPGWAAADGRHLMNFLVFVLALGFLYILCLRFLKPTYAWLTTILFATQPVLFGYGFVNQKDIPFMTLFLGSVVLGLGAADNIAHQPLFGGRNAQGTSFRKSAGRFLISLRSDWILLSPKTRWMLLGGLAVSLAISTDLLFTGFAHSLAKSFLTAAYNGNAPAPIQTLFARVATDSYKTPLRLYVGKLDSAFLALSLVGVPILALTQAMAFSSALPSLARVWGFDWGVLKSPSVWGTAMAIGLTTCVRQVGAFAIALVGLYMLTRLKGRAIFPGLAITIVSGLVTWVTWPYLWQDPVLRFFSSFTHAVNFPSHVTLFQGNSYSASQLPWFFFPTMASIELTEPSVLAIAIGFFVALWRAVGGRIRSRQALAIVALWVAVPLALLFFSKMKIYGNIRHLLFLMPPLFLFGGLGIELLLSHVKLGWIKILLAGLVLMPGILGIVELRPYEDIYYNSFIGGVNGALGQYEVDRWCTSLREATNAINKIAPAGATVVVPQQTDQVAPFARPDLKLTSNLPMSPKADFVISCTYRSQGDWRTSSYRDVYDVKRGDAVLTSVWERADLR